MKLKSIFILLAIIIAGSCKAGLPDSSNNSAASADTLTVSAAISLKDSFNEIGALYKTKTGKTVNFNFGASGALQKQIETGAPVDIFASAGKKQMDELIEKGLIDTSTNHDFAKNTLVLIVPQDSKLNLTDFSQLNKAEVKKIAVGNPKTVPAGQYADELFNKTNLKTDLQSKLIQGEDVRQVLDYVVRGEVDAGIVYATDAKTASDKVRVVATAPPDSHEPILYPIALIKDGKQKPAAQAFIDIVLSADGQNILRKYGFADAAQK